MNFLVTGATGFIGRALIPRLLKQGHQVHAWVRDQQRAERVLDSPVLISESLVQHLSNPIDVIVNLAGEPIADARWTEQRKKALRASRIDLTLQLAEALERAGQTPGLVISGSAIGYYGSQPDDRPLDESSDFVGGFTHELCADWENAALRMQGPETRVCLLRTGVVLGRDGGALSKMMPAFRLGLGGPIGDGRQVMSWIHIDDWVDACLYLVQHEHLHGVFNFTAPGAVRNDEFSRTLARSLRRPAVLRVPCALLKLALGEAAELLCQGQRVLPARLLEDGFKFSHGNLDDALNQIVREP